MYWRHAEFVLDDWFQYLFYRQGQAKGLAGELGILRTLLENHLYHTFQLYWLSFAIDSVLAWILGYAPRIFFMLALLWHVANAWVFYRLLVRLHISEQVASLAGAFFVLIPTAHGPLFWLLSTGFYVRPPLFLFLFLISLAGTLEKGALTAWAAAWQALCIVLILFLGGAPSFFLLLLAGPWLAFCFFPRQRWVLALKTVAIHWTITALSLAVYVPFLNKVSPSHQQLVARYDFSQDFLVRNWRKFYDLHLPGISGIGSRAYYHLQPSPWQLIAAALSAVLVVALLLLFCGAAPPGRSRPPGRLFLFSTGMLLVAYAPLIFLIGSTLRHYYTFSSYLSLFLAALCCKLPKGRLAAGALLGAYFAACTVAEIQQCWTPMSEHTQAVKAALLRLKNLEPGDQVVIPSTPMVIGTAPTFALVSGPWDRSFAEAVTGVKDLEFWREIVIERGRLRFFHRHAMRDINARELARTHVLVGPAAGPYLPRHYVAEPVTPNQHRLHCLKDGDCRASGPVSRDEIYFPKPFEHGNLNHLHY